MEDKNCCWKKKWCSVAKLWPNLWPHGCITPGFPVFYCLPEIAQTHIHWINGSNHLILCCPLLLLLSVFPGIRVFSSKSCFCIKWTKYWSFSFSISPTKEYSRLISFMIDRLDLLAGQETLKSLLQNHSSISINSLLLSFLYFPTLTSIQDYWNNISFDYKDLCWKSDVSAF